MIVIWIILFILLQLFYLGFLHKIKRGLAKVKSDQSDFENKKFISVIIPFRNESETILENLKSLENQNISKDRYEVIYINDQSDDDSLTKLQGAISKSNISVFSVGTIKYNIAHKKYAIEFGIEKSKGEIILFTDADCVNKPTWISSMIAGFSNSTGLVSGPVRFTSDNSLFGKMQQLEFAGLILSGAGLIGNATPIICSSANLAFRKSAFDEVSGYTDLMGLSSGDDELLMQKIAQETNYKVKFCLKKDALVSTNPNENIKAFTQQRKRWASKGLYYKNKGIVIQLFLILFFYVGLIAQLFMGLVYNKIFLYTFIISFLTKVIMEYSVIRRGIGLLLEKISFRIFLLAELLHVPYIIYSAISGAFGNFIWKNRELKR